MGNNKVGGWAGKILRVDLGSGEIWTEPSLAYGQAYIGARGIAARIGWDEIQPGTGPFDPENPLIFGVGPLTGTSAPTSGRTTISTLSPQAYPYEWFSYSGIGGYWGPMLKYAGYDAIVVVGESSVPVYLFIDDDRVELCDASALWGQGTFGTQQQILDAHGPDLRVLAIGPAGENRSRISIIATGKGSAAGQGGFGAVMGAKKLKAVAVRGTGGVPIAHPEAFSDCTLEIAREMHAPSGCPKPTRVDPAKVEKYGERYCVCTQQCSSTGCRLSRYYAKVPGVVYPDQEYSGTIVCESALFGGVPDTFYDWQVGFEAGFELAQRSQDLGINHWELGLGIAPWLRKCHEEGLFPDLDGVPFDLDSPYFWDALFTKIAYREGSGDALAEGGLRAAEILGLGQELISEYYTAWGFAGHWDAHGDKINVVIYPYWLVTALQWAMSTRDPLSSGHGYAQNIMNWSPMFSPDGCLDWEILADVGAQVYGSRQAVHPASGYEHKAGPAVFHGHRSVTKDSLTVDDQSFPRIYSNKTADNLARTDSGLAGPAFESEMFRLATGMDVDESGFEQMAERVFNLERALQVRNWGRSREVDEQVIPAFDQMENWTNPYVGKKQALDRRKFAALLDEYYELRGWDQSTGLPTREKLDELDLVDVADDLAEKGLLP
jgi:aldehyde:ferredoxin oxidoreductase